MQSVYKEKQIRPVVKLEDRNFPPTPTSWEKLNASWMPISAEKDPISSRGCDIPGMQHPGHREEQKRKSRQLELEAQLNYISLQCDHFFILKKKSGKARIFTNFLYCFTSEPIR